MNERLKAHHLPSEPRLIVLIIHYTGADISWEVISRVSGVHDPGGRPSCPLLDDLLSPAQATGISQPPPNRLLPLLSMHPGISATAITPSSAGGEPCVKILADDGMSYEGAGGGDKREAA